MASQENRPSTECIGRLDCTRLGDPAKMFPCRAGHCNTLFHHQCVGISAKRAKEGWDCRRCTARIRRENFTAQQTIAANSTSSVNPENEDSQATIISQPRNVDRSPLEVINDQTRSTDASTRPVPGTSEVVSSNRSVDETEYYVHRLLKHRKRYGRLEYLVSWKGFPPSETTWEPELGLSNCYWKVHYYKNKHNLGPPTFPKPTDRTGASGHTESHNINNWVIPDKIMSAIHIYRDNKRTRRIPTYLIRLDGDKNYSIYRETSIYVITAHPHAYVALRDIDREYLTVADGQNLILEEDDVQEVLIELFKQPLRIIQFRGQKGIDAENMMFQFYTR